ncbi:MAG: hypothetical protein IKA71_02165 [Lentisphaeria bacterium]|nr:hypothetical protein [Lentisphaeria bacterium]
MKNIITSLTLTGLVLFFCGCGKEHKAPPTQKLELTVRFFRSIAKKNSVAAVQQGRKLYALDPKQDYILRLISIQESNESVFNAQTLIRQGRIQEALPIIASAAKQYPENRMLVSAYPKLVQLRNAEKLLIAMKNAKNASAMRGARIAARAGLSRNLTPQLRKYLQEYEKMEQRITDKERQHTLDANVNAKQDIKKAQQAAVERVANERFYQQQTAEKHAEGEDVRREAGAVPFENTEQKVK